MTTADVKSHEHAGAGGGDPREARCGACGKARPLLYSCKCGKSFCLKHLGASAHGCLYDHLEGHRRALAAKLEPVRGEKVPPV
jgi:hypothetical protein